MKVVVSNRNNVGRVTFGKVAKLGSVSVNDLSNFITTGQQDGDVLVYQANTDTYNIKTLPKVDGGIF
jgi:hypothetical protein